MWRDKLIEIKNEKGISSKMISEKTGLSVETIHRLLSPNHAKTDAPRIDTIADVCNALGVEMWEVFYLGDKSFVDLQVELTTMKAERDSLLAENGALKEKVNTLKDKVDTLKDEIIATHKYYNKIQIEK